MAVAIDLFLPGTHHDDCGMISLIAHYTKNCLKLGIPVIVGEETSFEEDHEGAISRANYAFASTEKLLELSKKLEEYFSGFKGKYFGLKALVEINNFIAKHQDEFLQSITDEKVKADLQANFRNLVITFYRNKFLFENLYRYHNGNYYTAAFLTFLKDLKIPYFGFDIEQKKRNELEEQMEQAETQKEGLEVMAKFEKIRIPEMSKHIIKQITALEKTGGMIFLCNLGMGHAHRLTAQIFLDLKNQAFSNKVTVNLHVVNAYINHPHIFISDPYSIRKQEIEEILKFLIKKDPPEFLSFYAKYPCNDSDITWDPDTENFHCFEMDYRFLNAKAIFLKKTECVLEKNGFRSIQHVFTPHEKKLEQEPKQFVQLKPVMQNENQFLKKEQSEVKKKLEESQPKQVVQANIPKPVVTKQTGSASTPIIADKMTNVQQLRKQYEARIKEEEKRKAEEQKKPKSTVYKPKANLN